ncbi:hypothetical protein CONPUDRAFT_160791 [Coniophora puteana RWD-64-598 SS2]|uniref:Uncharacterized protein n=1 Tax=Coniophora puteana (strain RWD-64-598) TaxID=741705 RepID=R7SD12_CONPW|nr:uncharacterized protein CONPUDRAFT_160791 [Coniophora puteana RWD-64-598 SS2]EIW73725.1 hypothetical protein CONPUDRAFT_160791 [Coniophora puteana RWD-64-598 SS2]
MGDRSAIYGRWPVLGGYQQSHTFARHQSPVADLTVSSRRTPDAGLLAVTSRRSPVNGRRSPSSSGEMEVGSDDGMGR